MDKVYFDSTKTIFLDSTRLDGSSTPVSRSNPNDDNSVVNQIMEISRMLLSNGCKEIFLADDVVFSGNVLKSIINIFNSFGINVIGIKACICTQEGYNYFNSTLPLGLEAGFIMTSPDVEEVCERDFYFGIPQSGISISTNDGIMKAPYFLPFGNPVERASIPESDAIEFSKYCIDASSRLWEEICSKSKRDILCRELPERIIGTNEFEPVLLTLNKWRDML